MLLAVCVPVYVGITSQTASGEVRFKQLLKEIALPCCKASRCGTRPRRHTVTQVCRWTPCRDAGLECIVGVGTAQTPATPNPRRTVCKYYAVRGVRSSNQPMLACKWRLGVKCCRCH